MTCHTVDGTSRSKLASVLIPNRRDWHSLVQPCRTRIRGSLAGCELAAPCDRQATPDDTNLHLIKPMEMMDRPMAVADGEPIGRGDRGADPGLGAANRGLKALTFGKTGCDR
jgi:hypothetical protein